jgi:hypothetical protein
VRRILLLVIGVLALAIAAPSVASAHGHRHHHHHKAKHARVKHFGGKANVDPAGPAAPGDAGTVASFDQGTGVLTLTLADGSTVSGKVTSDTNVNCIAPATGPTATASHDGGSGDQGDDDQGDQGDDQGGDGHDGHCSGQSACDASDLVPGAVVHEAILKIGSTGAEFKLVLLVKQQATA